MVFLAIAMAFHLRSAFEVNMDSSVRYHQKCLLKARAWTHMHIGCGRDIGRWEYFFTPDGRQLSFLDYDKLAAEAMTNEFFIDRLTEAASRDPSGSLQKFFRNFQANDPKLAERLCSSAGLRSLPMLVRDLPPDARSIRRLRLFVGSPNCYIPGSSIKGALRSGYLAEVIANSKSKSDYMPRDPGADDFSNLRMLKERLQKTFRFNADDTRLFENLIVRDSKMIDPLQLGIASIGLFGSRKRQPAHNSKFKGKPNRDSDEYAEVMLARTEFEIEVILRTSRRYKLPINELKELLEMADTFYRRVWQAEKDHQSVLAEQNKSVPDTFEFYANPELTVGDDCYLLRVGYGSGQMSHSVLLPYREYYKKDFSECADSPLRHASLYARKKPELKKRQPYPFTARSALAGEMSNWVPLGWVAVSKKLESVDED